MSLKKIVASVMAVLLLTLTACSNTSPGGSAADESETVPDPVASDIPAQPDEKQDRSSVPDNLPEIDFGGRDFRAAQQTSRTYEFYAEELTGEGTNDSVFNRNLKIESRFNVKIVSVDYDSLSSITNDVDTLVRSGTDAYEVVSHYAYKAYTPIHAHAYRNWLEVPNIDFSRPWWNSLANGQNTINGILYTATGDINISSLLTTYAFFFSVPVTEKYGITPESLYNAVYEGTWTIDYFIGLTSSIYEDSNGNGKRDDKDTYGFAAWPGISCDVWLASFDQPITVKDEEGFPVPAINSEKTVAALEKMYQFYYNTDGGYGDVSSAENEVNMFAADCVCFVPSIFDDAFTVYRYMDSAYGILPYPKWDESQEMYLTNSRDQYTVIGIPAFKTDDDLPLIGTVTEALSAESWRSVYPEYYDIALKGKYSLDEDTSNMVDLVLAGRNYDFSFLFGEAECIRIPYLFRDMMADRDSNFASRYKRMEKALRNNMKKIRGYYEG